MQYVSTAHLKYVSMPPTAYINVELEHWIAQEPSTTPLKSESSIGGHALPFLICSVMATTFSRATNEWTLKPNVPRSPPGCAEPKVQSPQAKMLPRGTPCTRQCSSICNHGARESACHSQSCSMQKQPQLCRSRNIISSKGVGELRVACTRLDVVVHIQARGKVLAQER